MKDDPRFWRKVDRTQGECWLWTGAKKKGYGKLRRGGGRNLQAHRYAYELLVGPIPPGLVIDHLCRVPACVNPTHLEPVTHRENLLRGVGPTAQKAAQKHCIRGHAFDDANTKIVKGGNGRACRICQNESHRKHLAKKRGQLA